MKPFIFENWHAWEGTAGIMLSDELAKNLWQFADVNSCMAWLLVAGFKPAARALHSHIKSA